MTTITMTSLLNTARAHANAVITMASVHRAELEALAELGALSAKWQRARLVRETARQV